MPERSGAPPGQRTLMGFDHGSRKIGVAIGQEITASARPLTILPNRNQRPDWNAITRLIAQWRPDRLVVGLPYHLDGAESAQTRQAARFARQLQGRTGLPIETMDERLSSEAARDAFAELHRTGARKRHRQTDIDDLAAALILEHWLQERREEGVALGRNEPQMSADTRR